MYISIVYEYNLQVRTPMLHSTAVRVKVNMSKRLSSSQTTQYECFTVRMDDVHELSVRTV